MDDDEVFLQPLEENTPHTPADETLPEPLSQTLPPPGDASAAALLDWLLDNGWNLHRIARALPTNAQGGVASRRTLQRILGGDYSGSSLEDRLRWLVETGGEGEYLPPSPPSPPPVKPPRLPERRPARKPVGSRKPRGQRSPTQRTRRVPRRLLRAAAPHAHSSRLGTLWKLLRWGALAAYGAYVVISSARADARSAPSSPQQPKNRGERSHQQPHRQQQWTEPPAWALVVPPAVPPPSYRTPPPSPGPPPPPHVKTPRR